MNVRHPTSRTLSRIAAAISVVLFAFFVVLPAVASFDHLISTPADYGVTWDVEVGNAVDDGQRDQARTLLEHCDHASFATPRTFGEEGRRHDGLARSGRPGDQQRVAARQSAPHQRVEAGHPHSEARGTGGRGWPGGTQGRLGRRENLNSSGADTERVKSGQRRLPAHLHDLYLAHDRVSLRALPKPDQPIGDREHRAGIGIAEVFTNQERRRLPARHQHAEPLNELLQRDERVTISLAGEDHRAKRIDEDQRGGALFHCRDDLRQHLVQISGGSVVGEIDEVYGVVDLIAVEAFKLLHVAQHLERRLAHEG